MSTVQVRQYDLLLHRPETAILPKNWMESERELRMASLNLGQIFWKTVEQIITAQGHLVTELKGIPYE